MDVRQNALECIVRSCFIVMNKPVIMVTRFNNLTKSENEKYCVDKKFYGSIYGSPVKISPKILEGTSLIVVEMNISQNVKGICGVGLIKNNLDRKLSCKIYENKKFNKYIYLSEYRIDKSMFNCQERDFMHNLEQVLFKTKAHLQRGVGITKVPTGNLKRVNIDYTRIESTCHDSKPTVIVNYLVQMFKNRFGDFSHLDAQ